MFWYPLILYGLHKYYSNLDAHKKSYQNLEIFLAFVAHLFIVSYTPHKENRFLLCLYPIIIVLAAHGFIHVAQKFLKLKNLLIAIIIISCYTQIVQYNILYTPASLAVMRKLRREANPIKNLMVITTCCTVPLYSQLHIANITSKQFECYPVYNNQELSDHHKLLLNPVTEAKKFVEANALRKQNDIIIQSEFYDYYEEIYQYLSDKGYKEVCNALHMPPPLLFLESRCLLTA